MSQRIPKRKVIASTSAPAASVHPATSAPSTANARSRADDRSAGTCAAAPAPAQAPTAWAPAPDEPLLRSQREVRDPKSAAERAVATAAETQRAAHRFKTVKIGVDGGPPAPAPLLSLVEALPADRRQAERTQRKRTPSTLAIYAAADAAAYLAPSSAASASAAMTGKGLWYALSAVKVPPDWNLTDIKRAHEKRCGEQLSSEPIAATHGEMAAVTAPALIAKALPAQPLMAIKPQLRKPSLVPRKLKGTPPLWLPPLSAPPPPHLYLDGTLPRPPTKAPGPQPGPGPGPRPSAAVSSSAAAKDSKGGLLSWLGLQPDVSGEGLQVALPAASRISGSPASTSPSASKSTPPLEQPAPSPPPGEAPSPCDESTPPSRQQKFRNLSRSQSLARQSPSSQGSPPSGDRQASRRRRAHPGEAARMASFRSTGDCRLPLPSCLPPPSRTSMPVDGSNSASASWLPPPRALPAPSRMSMSGPAPEIARDRTRSRSTPRPTSRDQGTLQA